MRSYGGDDGGPIDVGAFREAFGVELNQTQHGEYYTPGDVIVLDPEHLPENATLDEYTPNPVTRVPMPPVPEYYTSSLIRYGRRRTHSLTHSLTH